MEAKHLSKAEKTKRKIESAFFALAMKAPGTLPNVSEICAELDIYRSTFYNYYSSVDELVASVSRDMADEMENYYKGFYELGTPQDSVLWNVKNSIGGLAHLLKKRRQENIVLLSPELNLQYRRDIYGLIRSGVMKSLADASEGERESTAIFMAEGVLAVLYHWLVNGNMTVGDFGRYLSRLEHSVLEPAMNNNR